MKNDSHRRRSLFHIWACEPIEAISMFISRFGFRGSPISHVEIVYVCVCVRACVRVCVCVRGGGSWIRFAASLSSSWSCSHLMTIPPFLIYFELYTNMAVLKDMTIKYAGNSHCMLVTCLQISAMWCSSWNLKGREFKSTRKAAWFLLCFWFVLIWRMHHHKLYANLELKFDLLLICYYYYLLLSWGGRRDKTKKTRLNFIRINTSKWIFFCSKQSPRRPLKESLFLCKCHVAPCRSFLVIRFSYILYILSYQLLHWIITTGWYSGWRHWESCHEQTDHSSF